MRGDSTRSQIAREAARLMLEGGMRDFQLAKRKAASRLGVFDRGEMPNNLEIEEAMSDYQRLFRADSQPQKLAELRRTAVNAMEFERELAELELTEGHRDRALVHFRRARLHLKLAGADTLAPEVLAGVEQRIGEL